jgi:uncharacterized protein YuzE
MKLLRYDSDVDALYIDLSDAPVADTHEIEPGVMLDYDADGAVIGIEILDFQARLQESQGIPIPAEAALQSV